MAKWDLSELCSGPDYKALYKELLKEHEELKKTVHCDYYEAYLLEKKKRETLEAKFGKPAQEDSPWDYYHP
jgi:hypothetical protein